MFVFLYQSSVTRLSSYTLSPMRERMREEGVRWHHRLPSRSRRMPDRRLEEGKVVLVGDEEDEWAASSSIM